MADKKSRYKGGRQKLIIIDGNALIHRSFHALPPTMKTKSGEMTNAVYGFASVLIKSLREFRPKYVVLTLDKKGPTFRHKEFFEYKAHRQKAPDDLYKQIPRVKEIAKAFNIPVFELAGYEADDLIGTIADRVGENIEKIIVTGDMDTLQLVNTHTKVYTMSRGLSDSVIYDIKAIKSKYQLAPNQLIDYRGLRGDPSDNIPGVKGVGEKTAIELLRDFQTLDAVYEYLEDRGRKTEDRIKPRITALLKKHKKEAYLSRRLAVIKRDVKINFDLEKSRFNCFNKKKLVKILSELEFKSLLPRLRELGKSSGLSEENAVFSQDKFERDKKEFDYCLVDSGAGFKIFLAKLKKQKEFTFDTETSSFDTLTARLLGISFSWEKGKAYYVKIRVKKSESKNNQEIDLFNYKDKKEPRLFKAPEEFDFLSRQYLKELKPIFENKEIKKNGHNIKFDIKVMAGNGVKTAGKFFDTMIASYLLNPGTRQHGLDVLTFSELGFEKISKDDLLGTGRDRIGFSEVSEEKLCLYSCEDADFTHRLAGKLARQLKKQKLNKLFKEIEMPLVPVLAEMEISGIKIDRKFLEKLEVKIEKKIKNLQFKIWRLSGTEFNINSTQQLKKIFFERLAISTEGISRNKTGYSTAAAELEKLKDAHPIIRPIQKYRELTKLSSTYIKALPKLVNFKTSRVHTSFNQAVTATGRLSSTDPNLQNIPIRTELGREIRKAFVSPDRSKLVSLDYSQIELRLAAHFSSDSKMIRAFLKGLDIHSSTAAEINNVLIEKVTRGMRRQAKAINFGIIYGQGPHGLAQVADISYAQAKAFIEEYFASFSQVEKFIGETIKKARKDGYVETFFGRRRYLPEINFSVVMVRKAAERMAVNTILQGTAADMIKLAMIEIAKVLREFNFNKPESNKARMLLQVHDELLFEIKNEKIFEIVSRIKKIMENIIKLKVPIIVDVKTGDNWGEMKRLKI